MKKKKPAFHWKLKVVLLFEKYFGQEKQLYTKSIEKARKGAAFGARLSSVLFNKKVKVQAVSDHIHKHINYRLYRNSNAADQRAILFFHSGGYALFDHTSLDYSCRRICKLTNSTLISVDYRRTPENKFPAAHEDALEMLKYIHGRAHKLGIDPAKIIVMGDSAGGNLSGYLGLYAIKEGLRPAAQVLIYPWINMNMEFPSIDENAEGNVLTRTELEWYAEQMFSRPEHRSDPRADLLKNTDFSEVPPAMVITCEYDPLRDEGNAFGKLLAGNGVAVECIEYPDMVHGFLYFPATFRKGYDPFGDIASFIDRHIPASSTAP